MKKSLKIAGFVVSAIITAFTINAFAQYNPPSMPDPAVVDAEKGRSLTDCLTFAGNFTYKNRANDERYFKKQFGESVSSFGETKEFKYDKYTKIFLNCNAKTCKGSCQQ